MTHEEPLLNPEDLATVADVRAARFDDAYEPTADRHRLGGHDMLERVVTVVFDAELPEHTTFPAATADLLYMAPSLGS